MYSEVLFHGTEIERGKKILEQKRMFISSGDKHWLGDGGYLYEDDFYAYKWIRDMYKANNSKYPYPPESLFEEYQIVKFRVETGCERVFDLDKPINKIQFDAVYKHCKENQKYSKRLAGQRFTEGVILNIMFNNMGYIENYDVVIATFKGRYNKYTGMPMRLNFISEKQICVKQISKAIPLEFYECKDKISDFHYYIDNLYSVVDKEETDLDRNVLIYNSYDRTKLRKRRKSAKVYK